MIKRILIGIALNGLALYATTYAIHSLKYQGSWKFFLLAGLIIGLLNTFVRPILKIFTFPLIFITLGLFFVVINAVILYLTQYIINAIHLNGITFTIQGIGTYLAAAFIFGIVNWIEHLFFHKKSLLAGR